MINMKMSAEEAKEGYNSGMMDQPEYPYGLCISLDDGSLEKLGITALPKVGSEMQITARCVVTSVGSNQVQGGDLESRVSLQITDMSVGQTEASQNNSHATMLYGNMD